VQEVPSDPVPDQTEHPTNDKPESPAQSAGELAIPTALPNLSAPLVTSGRQVATSQIPANEKLAFTARLTQPDVAPPQVQARPIQIPQPSHPQTTNETRTNAGPSAAPTGKDVYQTAEIKKVTDVETVMPMRETSSALALDFRPTATPPQHDEPVHGAPTRSLAVQDVQPTLPEVPKPPASSEILLQLAGKDQSTASVRVIDRSGTVNVTVHAADAELRTSLRSNLSDLATQLTSQGYKTEVVKPTVIAANTNNQHDSRESGRDASGQQQHQSTPDGRQPQRDRRSNSDRWRQELDQETSGTPGTPGGNR